MHIPKPPGLIDSHCHLNHLDLTKMSLDAILKEAEAASVTHCLSVCITPEDIPVLEALADQYPQIYFSVGVHPSEVRASYDETTLMTWAKHPRCIAFGETGLDFYRSPSAEAMTLQINAFRSHIRAALRAQKPLIVHTRQAQEATIRVLKEEGAEKIGGVLHCFTETFDMAKQAMDLDFYISFSGIITFKNATMLQDVVRQIPLNRILIETDAPYLAPMPYRGQSNRPAWVRYVALALSTLKNVSYEDIVKCTTENFYRCFFRGVQDE